VRRARKQFPSSSSFGVADPNGMKEIRLTSGKEGEHVYCVDSPDKGERVRLSKSEHAEPVHATYAPSGGKWIYIDRIKTVLVGSRSESGGFGFGRASERPGKFCLLKIAENESGDNWLLEIRDTNPENAKPISGDLAGCVIVRYCELKGPYTLDGCFTAILMMNRSLGFDLLRITDPEVYEFATRYFYGSSGRPD
jgi:hypothetical protein